MDFEMIINEYKNKIAALTQERNHYHKMFCFATTTAISVTIGFLIFVVIVLYYCGR